MGRAQEEYSKAEIRDIADDLARGTWDSGPLNDRDRAMMKYTHKLAGTPNQISESDIAALREAGFSDCAIGDIAANCALFAFFTRIVDGLGATLGPNMIEDATRIGIGLHAKPAAD